MTCPGSLSWLVAELGLEPRRKARGFFCYFDVPLCTLWDRSPTGINPFPFTSAETLTSPLQSDRACSGLLLPKHPYNRAEGALEHLFPSMLSAVDNALVFHLTNICSRNLKLQNSCIAPNTEPPNIWNCLDAGFWISSSQRCRLAGKFCSRVGF